jgi:hypothetical protein
VLAYCAAAVCSVYGCLDTANCDMPDCSEQHHISVTCVTTVGRNCLYRQHASNPSNFCIAYSTLLGECVLHLCKYLPQYNAASGPHTTPLLCTACTVSLLPLHTLFCTSALALCFLCTRCSALLHLRPTQQQAIRSHALQSASTTHNRSTRQDAVRHLLFKWALPYLCLLDVGKPMMQACGVTK